MITEKAMLAVVHISIWTAVKYDRKVSRDLADQHGAHKGAGRYNKQLLRSADKLDELRTLAGQIRQYSYKITLPWSDEGFRLLPSNLYFDLMARMREFEASFEQGVESFLRVYPQYIEQVRPELNGLFREEDYPGVEKLRTKFGVKLEILPIPSGADFRVQMSAEEQARVSREIDANVRESLTRGTEDLWRRLREVVAHMVERLNEPESRFHGSLVTNVVGLVEILPRLNVNGDADLNHLAEQIQQRLCNYSAQDLKKHDLLRVTTATDAADIVAQIDDVLRDREAAQGPSERRRYLYPHVRVHGGARDGLSRERAALRLFSHPWSKSKPDQYSVRIAKPAHCLAPWFLLFLISIAYPSDSSSAVAFSTLSTSNSSQAWGAGGLSGQVLLPKQDSAAWESGQRANSFAPWRALVWR
jgi:hypothetical protein